jgi:aspartate/methionine/tyrosine aminotransferase
MKLPPFLLDIWLAKHDFAEPPIEFNLASSTGPAWELRELMALGGAGMDALGNTRLGYAPPQGAKLLRERIGALAGVDPDCVLVTTGASEALMAVFCRFAEPGASIVLPKPAYPAMPVLARAFGLEVSEYVLEPEKGFAHTAANVLAAVKGNTRAVLVNTPHNPTGAVMSASEQRTLAEALAARGIPLIVDEVYHPLYFGAENASAATLPNTIVIGDFAKALSLPGLRLGWIIERDAHRREELLDLRSYFTISNSPVTEAIAVHALDHAPTILGRLHSTARANLARLEKFMVEHAQLLGFPPQIGGTTAFPWFRDGRDSRPFAEALAKKGVLVAPGDCFGAPAHLRVGFAATSAGYDEALARFSEALRAAVGR